MAETFYLEIITPDRQFYIGPAQSMILPIQDGQYGVLPGHEATVTAITPGELRFQVDGEWRTAVVSSGFAEITPDYTIVLASAAERPEEIDLIRAREAQERAAERLRHKQSLQEYYNSKAALARAMARLKAGRKR
jgi:F-type H+-transporting ATPase subunit epsilon